jgi:hypothetical protein
VLAIGIRCLSVLYSGAPVFAMNNTKSWNILSWNVRGINSQSKWDHIRNKISECAASIICLQETKRDSFDQAYIFKFCPRHINTFAFFPSVGASGGLLICWADGIIVGEVADCNSYAIT